jgi:hypothetical protein
MKRYIGVKEINAKPMTRREYNDFRGWDLPANENGDDKGFLVEYIDGGSPNTPEFMGYVSWSPSEVFERAYRPFDGMTFGTALEVLKRGMKVARKGWNGKGMWLSLSTDNLGGAPVVRYVDHDKFWSKNNSDFAVEQGGCAMVLPCITMKTVDSTGREAILIGWLASQTDMLSEDWVVV